MTVKSLTYRQKQDIADAFIFKRQTIDELVVKYERSRRTIIRVLDETGCQTGLRTRTRKPKPAPVPTPPVAIPTKTPWWKRWLRTMGEYNVWAGPRL
jgi:hypothetical protein